MGGSSVLPTRERASSRAAPAEASKGDAKEAQDKKGKRSKKEKRKKQDKSGSSFEPEEASLAESSRSAKAAFLLASVNKDADHWSLKLPTIGTVHHALGNCKPCVVFMRRDKCEHGRECTFCHSRQHFKVKL